MTRKMGMVFLGVLLLALGCGSDSSDDSDDPNDKENETDTGDTDNEGNKLVRLTTPQSEFAPNNIESAIDDIVDALNDEEAEVGMKLAFVPKELENFFAAAVLGANRAHSELGALGNVVAPTLTDEGATAWDLQRDIIDDQIANGAVGLGVAPHSVDVTPSIDAAVDAGATVITFDSDAADSKRQLYIGTINKQAGKTGGETLAELLGDKVGTVVILGYDDTIWQDGYDRTHEARKALEAAGHTVVIRQTDWGDHQGNVDFIQETLENAEPEAVGCLGVFANSYGCAEAAVAAGVEDDITIVAFDTEPETLQYMDDGIIQATHAQRIYYMGYMIPFLLYAANTIGLDETKSLVSDLMVDEERIDTGLDVIHADSIGDYNLFLDELGDL